MQIAVMIPDCNELRPKPKMCSPVQGQAGNAVQYVTRNQALKKLQLRLSEFRCSLAYHLGSL